MLGMTDHANVHEVTFGTGQSIFEATILPAVEKAQREVIIITCFLAPSPTKDALNECLLRLSSAALQRGQAKIQVRIGFSSSGLLQKLFHTSSPSGRTYQPSEWARLGLLSREDLGGLDVEVKSMFFLPFSVWHPKFVIVDRARVFLPSCNVSWEEWFEGCASMSGVVVERFVEFWRENWANEHDRGGLRGEDGSDGEDGAGMGEWRLNDVACKFLPSPHHRNPNFALPWQRCAAPPSTPLNTHILDSFASAKESIYIQTPNVTCPPVLDAILASVQRGVDVTIVTSERLMILEQLVTAGTTTDRCMRRLVRQYTQLLQRDPDEEAGLIKLGRLQLSYYVPRQQHANESGAGAAEPVQSHLKLTVVDGNTVVFGSGNMDRASWYTSQELGVAFFSEELIRKTMQKLQTALEGRTKLVYDSESNGTR